MSGAADLDSIPAEFLSLATTACTPCQNKGARSSGCCALLSRVKARGPTITCYRENCRPKCHKVSSGKFKQKENQKQFSPPLAFPCRRGHLSGVSSAAATSLHVSSRGRIIRPKVSFESGKDSADGAPLVQPIAEGPRAQSEQTRLHARTRCSSRTKSDAAPTTGVALADPASDPASERAAIAPQLRADMLHFLAENPDLRQRSRRTWEWFKKKTGCQRSADSLKSHASSKLFRMEQGGEKSSLKRPQRLKIKKDMWKR